ncbi:Rv3654c family TadE-like protein [Dactylosporangium sp. NPDC049140]|uniref:Rv3654c family TadE-like protein n=1 Tax=Dactylosporangium sp. NPDC049140 TaxID=3155647 RepID=UPI0033C8D4FD
MNRGPGDRGSASLICLAVGLALAALALGISTGGGVLVAAHRARNAADSAALAGALKVARGSEAACAAAGRLAGENRGRLAACEVAGAVVTVTVEVATRAGLVARARARAGPVGWSGAESGAGPPVEQGDAELGAGPPIEWRGAESGVGPPVEEGGAESGAGPVGYYAEPRGAVGEGALGR